MVSSNLLSQSEIIKYFTYFTSTIFHGIVAKPRNIIDAKTSLDLIKALNTCEKGDIIQLFEHVYEGNFSVRVPEITIRWLPGGKSVVEYNHFKGIEVTLLAKKTTLENLKMRFKGTNSGSGLGPPGVVFRFSDSQQS